MRDAVTHVLFLAGGNGRNAISGAEHHVLTLVQALAARGVDTELIVLLWQTDDNIEDTLQRVQASGVRVCRVERRPGRPTYLSRLVRALDSWRRLGIALRSRRDRVVHMHMELVMQVIAARAAGCRRLVMTIHNDEPHYRRPLVKGWFRALAAAGVQFVAITDHVRRYLVSAVHLPSPSVVTITYGVPMPPRRAVSRAQLGIADSDFVVGFVGRLTAQKNIPLLLRAMALRPSMRCVIVGDGELKAELQQLAGELGCRNVTFLGAQARAAGLMPAFDLLCLPSRWEGLGVVLVEAMLQGVPIVASRAGAIPEVLDDGRCGLLIDPASVDSLCGAIDTIRDDAARRRSLTLTAQQRAATVYAVTRMAADTHALYNALCGRRAAAADAAA
ncbi:MAG TPA: glycosyltransferase family 4 protein [Vicinamibacterales bacterium]